MALLIYLVFFSSFGSRCFIRIILKSSSFHKLKTNGRKDKKYYKCSRRAKVRLGEEKGK